MEQLKLLILFGSRAKDKATNHSDVDVAVLSARPLSWEEKSRIAFHAGELLGVSEDLIDLVDIRTAPPLLRYKIAEEGKLLEGTREDFLRFRVLSWKLYQDTARLRRAREKNIAQRANA